MEKYFKNKESYFLVIPIILLFLTICPNIFLRLFNFLEGYSNAVLAVVAILGLFFGQSWLNTSKKKMKGQLEFDIARKYLKAVLKLRDTTKIVRAPFISLGEIQNALQQKGYNFDDYEDKEKVNRSVYSLRWEKLQEVWSGLDEILLDAELSWGSEAVGVQKELDTLIRKLRSVIWLFVNSEKTFSKTTDENFNILYGTHDENDDFAKKIDTEVEKIRKFLQKYL